MTSLAVINLGLILTGQLEQPITSGDCVLVEDGIISAVGDRAQIGGDGGRHGNRRRWRGGDAGTDRFPTFMWCSGSISPDRRWSTSSIAMCTAV